MWKLTGLLCLPLLLPAPASAAEPALGTWELKTHKDAMTDEVAETATTVMRDHGLMVMCWPQNPAAGVRVAFIPGTGMYGLRKVPGLDSFERYFAKLRIDSGPVTDGLFEPTAKALFLLDEHLSPDEKGGGGFENIRNVIRFLDRLSSALILRIRIEKTDGTNADWVLFTRGAGAAVAKLKTLCPNSWSAGK